MAIALFVGMPRATSHWRDAPASAYDYHWFEDDAVTGQLHTPKFPASVVCRYPKTLIRQRQQFVKEVFESLEDL